MPLKYLKYCEDVMDKKFRMIKIACLACLFCMLTACILPCLNAYAALPSGAVYLSDMTPISAKTGWGQVTYDRDLSGGVINVGGTIYSKGVSVHANSILEYDIGGMEYETFTAYVGVSRAEGNRTTEQSSVDFEVLADGVSLYKSGVIRYADKPVKLSVSLPFYTEKLTLKVTNADDGSNGDHATWADATIAKGKYAKTDLYSLSLSQSKNDLKVGDTTKLEASALSYGGSAIDVSTLELNYSTETPQMIEIDRNGNVKILSNGIGVVNVSATQKSGDTVIERRASLVISSNVSSEGRLNTTLTSPASNLEAKIYTDELGSIYYTVSEGGHVLLGESMVGVSTEAIDLDSGLTLVSSHAKEINEVYYNVSGKTSSARNHANALLATFEKNEYIFILEFRAYDDGFAYRYTVDCKDKNVKSIVIDDETGYFTVSPDAKAFYEKIVDRGGAFNYEENYVESSVSEMTKSNVAFPLLFSDDDEHWMLLSEAELYGDSYVGSALYAESEGKLALAFAPKTSDGVTVTTSLAFTSPWRCGIAGGLDDVVESNLIENVSERRADKDFSWVKTGVTSWLWLEEGADVHSDPERIKDYIDLSAEMKWEYVLLDAGWQPDAPWGCYDWFAELVHYANKKQVGIIVWVHYTKLDTPEEREVLKTWSQMGIKGIKVDFMDSESQNLIDFYRVLYEECTKYCLLVNPHGANKPTGERQYWPNVINREAVRGEEYQNYLGTDLAIWAFTRGVLGPMDVTPRVIPGEESSITAAAQLAIAVHFESGMPCMSSTPETYRTSVGSLFLKDLPSAWDQIEFVDGYPGDYSVVARRSDRDWYVSGLTSEARSVNVSYDFLEEGSEYAAYIFTDGDGTVELTQKRVSSLDDVDLEMSANGGFAIKLVKIGGDDEDNSSDKNEKPEDTAESTEKATDGATEAAVTERFENTDTESKKGCSSQIFAPAVAVCAAMASTLMLKKKKTKKE